MREHEITLFPVLDGVGDVTMNDYVIEVRCSCGWKFLSPTLELSLDRISVLVAKHLTPQAIISSPSKISNFSARTAAAYSPCLGTQRTGTDVMLSFGQPTPYDGANRPSGPEESVRVVDVFLPWSVAKDLLDLLQVRWAERKL